jgi:predicted ATPase
MHVAWGLKCSGARQVLLGTATLSCVVEMHSPKLINKSSTICTSDFIAFLHVTEESYNQQECKQISLNNAHATLDGIVASSQERDR